MITKEEIGHLEMLAKLNPQDVMEDKLAIWLSETLDYVKILESVDTSNIPAITQVTGLTNVFRQDDSIQDQDLKLSGTYIKTSKVLKRDPPASNAGGSLIMYE